MSSCVMKLISVNTFGQLYCWRSWTLSICTGVQTTVNLFIGPLVLDRSSDHSFVLVGADPGSVGKELLHAEVHVW